MHARRGRLWAHCVSQQLPVRTEDDHGARLPGMDLTLRASGSLGQLGQSRARPPVVGLGSAGLDTDLTVSFLWAKDLTCLVSFNPD